MVYLAEETQAAEEEDVEEEARLDDKVAAARAAAEARAARPLTPTTNYWRKRKEPGAGELCRAHAIRAFEAVERVEMGLALNDRVLVVKDELVPGAGWIFATRGDDRGYVPRNYLAPETVPEMPYESESTATAISASAFYRM